MQVPFVYEFRNVMVSASESIADEEVMSYVDRGLEMFGDKLGRINLEIDGDFVGISYYEIGNYPPFERIRRITGYLVGTLSRFNDAKLAEVNDRVKHGTRQE